MAYDGYLIKVADNESMNNAYTIPHNFILEKSYKPTYSTIDVDSTRLADGVLYRNAMEHVVPHCVLTIKPLDDSHLSQMFGANGGISTRIITISGDVNVEHENSLWVKMWIPKLNDYVTHKCYIPDIDFTIKKVVNTQPYAVYYDSFDLEFIGY